MHTKGKCVISELHKKELQKITVFKQVSPKHSCHWLAKQIGPPQTHAIGCFNAAVLGWLGKKIQCSKFWDWGFFYVFLNKSLMFKAEFI